MLLTLSLVFCFGLKLRFELETSTKLNKNESTHPIFSGGSFDTPLPFQGFRYSCLVIVDISLSHNSNYMKT